ncbi:MAG TPA: hypothetical protein VIV60_24975 [Polyangiaceae bacterium]
MTSIVIDNVRCDDLVRLGAQGDTAARRDLVEYLWPKWLEMARSSRRIQMLSNADDAVHDVAARLVEKFGQSDGRTLLLYASWRERNRDKLFEDWLRIVTTNVIRDYLRERVGSLGGNDADLSVKRLLNEFASAPSLEELGTRPPYTAAQTARELMEFANSRLRPEQLRVFFAWLQGETFEDIAVEQQRDAEAVRQLLRSSIAVLRRHFGGH